VCRFVLVIAHGVLVLTCGVTVLRNESMVAADRTRTRLGVGSGDDQQPEKRQENGRQT